MWTIEEALVFIRFHQQKVMGLGYYLALAGGVLNTGRSAKDLDIVCMPRTHDSNPDVLEDYIREEFGPISFLGKVPTAQVLQVLVDNKSIEFILAVNI